MQLDDYQSYDLILLQPPPPLPSRHPPATKVPCDAAPDLGMLYERHHAVHQQRRLVAT